MSLRIGISGWTYKPWRGVFYPEDLPQRDELRYAAERFRSIEVNGTHYGLQTPKSFTHWREQTPHGFVFSVKGGRYITHLRRLRDIHAPLANFFASGVLALEEKLGPFLWQFPPSFKFDAQLMASFLEKLPRDTNAAVRLGRQHDDHLKARAWLRPSRNRKLRHAVEIRHDSFLVPEFFELLRRHKIAFVLADTAGKWPYVEELTADFAYVRLHGDKELYASGYSEQALQDWANRIRHWQQGTTRDEARITDRKTPKDARCLRLFRQRHQGEGPGRRRTPCGDPHLNARGGRFLPSVRISESQRIRGKERAQSHFRNRSRPRARLFPHQFRNFIIP